MKMNKRRWRIIAAGIFPVVMVTSCSKGTGPAGHTGPAVIQSYLAPGQTVEVKITQEIPYGSTDTLIPIPGLSVDIFAGGTAYPLTYDGNAIYTVTGITIDTGITYQLKFTYNNQEVSATTTIPPRPTGFQESRSIVTVPSFSSPGSMPPDSVFNPVVFTWDNPNDFYSMMTLTCIDPNPTPIGSQGVSTASGTFRTSPTQSNQQSVGFGSFPYYGRYRVVLYRIWSDYAALYFSNGSNSTDLSTPPGNIINGYGIFTGINTADTLYLTVE